MTGEIRVQISRSVENCMRAVQTVYLLTIYDVFISLVLYVYFFFYC